MIGPFNQGYRPFPSSLIPLFQSESKCETILVKMTLVCMKMKLQAELIFIWKVSHLDSFWNRGTRDLGNGQLNKAFSGANKDSPWWTALKALLPPGAPWAPPGDPLVSWDCERWWFAKSTVRSFLACLEASTAVGFKYSAGTSLKKNVLLGSNWNRSAKEKDSIGFCFTIKFY